MLVSILHRVSGFGLAAGAAVLTWFLVAVALGHDAFAQFHSLFGSFIGRMVLYLFLLGLVFHMLNGVRHLVWDAGFGFSRAAAAASGWFVFFGSLLLSVILWLLAAGRFA